MHIDIFPKMKAYEYVPILYQKFSVFQSLRPFPYSPIVGRISLYKYCASSGVANLVPVTELAMNGFDILIIWYFMWHTFKMFVIYRE